MRYRQNNTPSSGRGAGNVGLSNSLHARAFSLQGLVFRLSCDGVKLLFITMSSLWWPEEKKQARNLQTHWKLHQTGVQIHLRRGALQYKACYLIIFSREKIRICMYKNTVRYLNDLSKNQYHLSEALTSQFQGEIQTVKMVFSDPVDLACESDSLGR